MCSSERQLLQDALAQADDNRTKAAKTLGIGRAMRHDKLKKRGLWGCNVSR